ncbi:MAG TPA: hypothetical protein DCS05_00470 [Nitrospiraceae bacterium]|nr:hypothetical protein [Nitrospiraceae bacterium]
MNLVIYPKDLQEGDKVFSIEYGYLTVEKVYPADPRYPLSQEIDTDRGRRDFKADRPLQGVIREP